MNSASRSRILGPKYFVGRMMRRAFAFVCCAAWATPLHAAKHTLHRIPGIYVTRDTRLLGALARHTIGTYWIDGFRMTISQRTEICWHHTALQFGPLLNLDAQPVKSLRTSSPCEAAPWGVLGQDAWLQYLATREYYPGRFKPLSATRIDVWKGGNQESRSSDRTTESRPARKSPCASTSAHELRYPNEGPIDVVCDAKVNSYVEHLYSALLRPSATAPRDSIAKQEIPNFYIVRPFKVRHNYDFEAIDGSVAACYPSGGVCTYRRPHADSTVREIVYAPDGAVLIPDTVFPRLVNEAQCLALLSYALAAVDQGLIEKLFRVQNYKRKLWTLSYKTSGRENADETGAFIVNLNFQVLRLGIRQMYLAGYDIRYAPFAWSAELGKPIRGSPVAPDYRHMPWYASYGFNVINQLYSNVDYSKLKRGRRAYQQFLAELRKADPQALAPLPRSHK